MIRGNDPFRMCVICRRRVPKKKLVRYVLASDGATLAVDEKQIAMGRGWYICDTEECHEKFRHFRVRGRKI